MYKPNEERELIEGIVNIINTPKIGTGLLQDQISKNTVWEKREDLPIQILAVG